MKQISNLFTSYELADGEGVTFSPEQRARLQNLLSITAMEKIALDYDPEHPLLFAQQEAYKKGQIELLSFLIEQSDVALNSEGNS